MVALSLARPSWANGPRVKNDWCRVKRSPECRGSPVGKHPQDAICIRRFSARKGHSAPPPTSSTIDRQPGLAEPSRQLVAMIASTTIGKERVTGRTANVEPFCTMEIRRQIRKRCIACRLQIEFCEIHRICIRQKQAINQFTACDKNLFPQIVCDDFKRTLQRGARRHSFGGGRRSSNHQDVPVW